jgi:hypothetical protein
MIPNHPPQNLKDPEQSPKSATDTWIALGLIIALVLVMIALLTMLGAGEADAVEMMQ